MQPSLPDQLAYDVFVYRVYGTVEGVQGRIGCGGLRDIYSRPFRVGSVDKLNFSVFISVRFLEMP